MNFQQSFSFSTPPLPADTQLDHPQFFTSFRLVRGRIVFFPDHLERLKRSFLFQIPGFHSGWAQIEKSLGQVLLDLTREFASEVVRGRILLDLNASKITVFQQQAPAYGGMISAGVRQWDAKLFPSWIKRWPYEDRRLALNESGSDEVLLHRGQRVLSGLTSNLFLFDGRVVKTPPLADGVLDGIARKQFIKYLVNLGYAVGETVIELGEIDGSCRVVMTNSVRGAREVSCLVKDNLSLEPRVFPEFSEDIKSWNRRNFE